MKWWKIKTVTGLHKRWKESAWLSVWVFECFSPYIIRTRSYEMKNKNCATHHSRCNGEHLWLSATLIPHQLFVAHPSQSNYMRPSIYRTLIGACRTCQNLHNEFCWGSQNVKSLWDNRNTVVLIMVWILFCMDGRMVRGHIDYKLLYGYKLLDDGLMKTRSGGMISELAERNGW